MGTILVRAHKPGKRPGDWVGYYGDRRIKEGEVFEISDQPLVDKAGKPIPGSIAAFSDAGRKGPGGSGWMVKVGPQPFAIPGPTSGAGSAPPAPPEPKGKGKGKSTGDKDVSE